MSELRFDGRVAVITGAGRGLGRSYALLLAARGAKVVVNDPGSSLGGSGVDAGPAQEVVNEIKSAGGEAVACIDSVATAEGGKAIIDAAMAQYDRIDILVHNAGITRRAPMKEMTHADFDAVLDVHLRGAFNVARPAFPLMCKAGYGRIVMTSSIAGLYGERNVANYCVSKAGIIGLSNALALEGSSEGVKCNVILPGAVTRMADGRDTSTYPDMNPDLVAPVIGWLAHESCAVNGEMFVSMAGRFARAFVAETPGIYQPSWTMEEVVERADEVRRTDNPVIFSIVPKGLGGHIEYSFQMAKKC